MPAAAQLNQVPAPEKIREATRAIFERPEFAEPPLWHQTLWEILMAIKEWLDRLGSWSEAHPTLARILFILALLILLACLGHVLYLALADVLPFRRNREMATAKSARWEILEGAAADWREALQFARAMLKEGNPRRAVWIAHRVLLTLLDQQGAVQFAGWKTNSHYLRECAPAHPWHATFAELTELYEQLVYASRQISTDVAEALVLRVDRLCSEAGPRP
jgi:phage shock protein PspC (stress-responsive transcriptional regulator)